MSLFDIDSDASSSSASCSDEDDKAHVSKGSATATSSTHTSAVRSADDVRAMLGLPSRYTLTQADVDRAAAQRRAAALAERGGGSCSGVLSSCASSAAASAATGTHATSSVFGNSINEALRQRQRTKEAVLLQRIRQQRTAEAGDATLAKVDRTVGVFVTDAYKEVLRRHALGQDDASTQQQQQELSSRAQPSHTSSKAAPPSGDAGSRGDDDDDDAPLAAYLRQLDAAAAAATTDDDAHDARNGNDALATAASHATRDMTVPVTSHDTDDDEQRRDTVSASMSPTSVCNGATQASTRAANASSTSESASSGGGAASCARPAQASGDVEASVSYAQAHYRAREARRLRRADTAYLLACAARCNERIARGVTCE